MTTYDWVTAIIIKCSVFREARENLLVKKLKSVLIPAPLRAFFDLRKQNHRLEASVNQTVQSPKLRTYCGILVKKPWKLNDQNCRT